MVINNIEYNIEDLYHRYYILKVFKVTTHTVVSNFYVLYI